MFCKPKQVATSLIMEKLNEVKMTGCNGITSDPWKEDHINEYIKIKGLLGFTPLQVSIDIEQDK